MQPNKIKGYTLPPLVRPSIPLSDVWLFLKREGYPKIFRSSIFLFLFLFSFPFLNISPAASTESECLNCHGTQGLEKVDERGKKVSLFVSPKDLKNSVHAGQDCATCHPQAKEIPHPKMKPVDCSQCHPADIAAELKKSIHGSTSPKVRLTCTHCHGKHYIQPAAADHFFPCKNCHTGAALQYKNSVHQKSVKEGKLTGASCHDCHGGHKILKAKDPQSSVYQLNLARTCGKCHGKPQQAEKGKKALPPHRDVYQHYMDTVHGRAMDKGGLLVAAVCTSCHGAHAIRSSKDPQSSIHRQNISKTCGHCHAGVEAIYEESMHGKWVRRGDPKAPSCTDCHTAHDIRRVDTYKWKLGIVQECGTCHEQSLKTFRDTFHGQVTVLGYARSARCSDCHGYHNVHPSRDPRSMTHPSNLLATCQKCHPTATEKFTHYYPHADYKKKEDYPVLHRTYVFMTTILLVTFGFFGLHTILWLPRSLRERLNAKKHPPSSTPPLPSSEKQSAGLSSEENHSQGNKI